MLKTGEKSKMEYEIDYSPTDENVLGAIKVDRAVFKGFDVGNFQTCKNWLSVNEEIYTFLKRDNKVIGYINFMPITEDCYKSFLKGDYKDYEINTKDISPFCKGKNLCLFDSVAILEEYRCKDAIKALWGGLQRKVENLQQRGVIVKSYVMDCVSNKGIKFAERLHAKFIRWTETGAIFEGTSLDIILN